MVAVVVLIGAWVVEVLIVEENLGVEFVFFQVPQKDVSLLAVGVLVAPGVFAGGGIEGGSGSASGRGSGDGSGSGWGVGAVDDAVAAAAVAAAAVDPFFETKRTGVAKVVRGQRRVSRE